jgi:hypothetical protein
MKLEEANAIVKSIERYTGRELGPDGTIQMRGIFTLRHLEALVMVLRSSDCGDELPQPPPDGHCEKCGGYKYVPDWRNPPRFCDKCIQ